VNTVNFKIVKSFIRGFLFSFCFFAQVKIHAFEVDLSRRQNEIKDLTSIRAPASMPAAPTVSAPANLPVVTASGMVSKEVITTDNEIVQAIKNVVVPTDATKEIVIIQTEDGFTPSTIQLKKDEVYKIHVVNLNMKEKNVSFLMDSFTQSHNTVYGNPKAFTIEPKVEGVFSFQCPETGMQGKVVVIPDASQKLIDRKMASEN
jgi:plastocyanin